MLLRASDRLADGTLIDITPAYDKVYGHSLDFAKTIANSGYITHTDSQGNRDIYGWNDFVVHYFQFRGTLFSMYALQCRFQA